MIVEKFKDKTYSDLLIEFREGFRVTGLLYNSKKRFSHHYIMIGMAMAINLWRGSVWGLNSVDGKIKKTLIKRVYN